MNPDAPPTGNKVVSWLKKNKLVAGIAAVGGVLFLVTRKGQTGNTIYDENGEPTDSTSVQLVPVSASPSEGTFEEDSLRERRERLEEDEERQRERERGEGSDDTPPEAAPVAEEAPLPEEPEPAPVAVSASSGITLHGKTFAAAIRVISRRDGKDARGPYIEYVLEFPGSTQRWHYYTKDHKWSKVGDSTGGPGANKPPVTAPPAGGGSSGPSHRPQPGVGQAQPVAGPPTDQQKQKARNEIQRLQGEIDGLQNHIQQLTNAIQAHPKAQQRGQWENERNADRANIDHKRNEITYWQART